MKTGFNPPLGTIVKVEKQGNNYIAILPDGSDVTEYFENYQVRNAVKENKALKFIKTATGEYQWRKVSEAEFTEQIKSIAQGFSGIGAIDNDQNSQHESILTFLNGSTALRPSFYKMNDLKWRFAIRTVLRGKNMMVVGPRGTGKTVLAFTLTDVLNRPFFNIPLGASQDPRSTLIGNVHYRPEQGTFIGVSEFIKGIQTENAIILLDEITRAHPDAWNILMSALDYKQRFVRIDEDANTPIINVAAGVTFIATANIGSQYTATRTLDAGLLDRFITIEVDYLDRESELDLLQLRVPGSDKSILNAITNVAIELRSEAASTDPRISDGLSTRSTIEMAELIYDGFTFAEAAMLVIYPQYSDAGGADSERSFVKQIVQKHIPVASASKESPFNLDPNSENDLPWA